MDFEMKASEHPEEKTKEGEKVLDTRNWLSFVQVWFLIKFSQKTVKKKPNPNPIQYLHSHLCSDSDIPPSGKSDNMFASSLQACILLILGTIKAMSPSYHKLLMGYLVWAGDRGQPRQQGPNKGLHLDSRAQNQALFYSHVWLVFSRNMKISALPPGAGRGAQSGEMVPVFDAPRYVLGGCHCSMLD